VHKILKKPRDSPGYCVITALESLITREAIQGLVTDGTIRTYLSCAVLSHCICTAPLTSIDPELNRILDRNGPASPAPTRSPVSPASATVQKSLTHGAINLDDIEYYEPHEPVNHQKRKRDQEQVKRQVQEQTVITVDSQDEEQEGTIKRVSSNKSRSTHTTSVCLGAQQPRSPALMCTRFRGRREGTIIIKEISLAQGHRFEPRGS
jgi:hypothetical protein